MVRPNDFPDSMKQLDKYLGNPRIIASGPFIAEFEGVYSLPSVGLTEDGEFFPFLHSNNRMRAMDLTKATKTKRGIEAVDGKQKLIIREPNAKDKKMWQTVPGLEDADDLVQAYEIMRKRLARG